MSLCPGGGWSGPLLGMSSPALGLVRGLEVLFKLRVIKIPVGAGSQAVIGSMTYYVGRLRVTQVPITQYGICATSQDKDLLDFPLRVWAQSPIFPVSRKAPIFHTPLNRHDVEAHLLTEPWCSWRWAIRCPLGRQPGGGNRVSQARVLILSLEQWLVHCVLSQSPQEIQI
ncbi:hypothetical protein E2C01_010488 [Portunus trituberculatus]|uniref:Uncharacterized protein n=1 Tax=Portunus trituberculatus TaxID=210409 RepID=A0A5B7D8W2_PORTR|nr:hypothetical protein [Portunus trituberculatus]